MCASSMRSDDQTIVSAFYNAPIAIHGWCAEGEGAPVVVNDAFCRITGYSPREIAERFGGDVSRLALEEDREGCARALRELAEYPHELTARFRLSRRDGTVVAVEDRVRSVRQSDGRIWLYGHLCEAEAPPRRERERKRVVVQTFGYLNVLIDGRPVVFSHEKAREMLAVLIDRQGRFVSPGELISCLWEDEPVSDNTQSRCRKAAYHLRKTLADYGLEGLIESTPRGYRRVRAEMIDCDLYRFMDGDPEARRQFRGAYMTDYSWAEQTLVGLTYEK